MFYDTPPLRIARFRFEMRPASPMRLPASRCGEVLYGAFGTVLRRIACDPKCDGAPSCVRRTECPYAALFEPAIPAAPRSAESGACKAFLFRPLNDGDEITPARPLRFELRLFGTAIESWGVFVDVFRRLSTTGLADRAVDLVSVLSLDWSGTSARILFDDGAMTAAEPIVLGFDRFFETAPAGDRVRIDFLTPTLIKDRRTLLRVPTLGGVIRRLRDRISTLSTSWESREWNADYRAIGECAESAVVRRSEGEWSVHERHSTRTRREMPVEGFRGTVFYDAVDERLWPLLRIGEEIHAGQHTVWGNGRYRLSGW